MKKLNYSLDKLTKNLSQKKDIRIFRIYQNWEKIVGSELRAQITPYKITGANGKVKLTILLNENIDYFLCQALKNEVMEKVNSFFGKNFVQSVSIMLDES